MKINGVMHNLLSMPWAMRQENLLEALDLYARDPVDEWLGLTDEDVGLDIEKDDGVAIVPIYGVIGYKVPIWMQKFMGMTSCEKIAEALEELAASSDIQAIVLDIDSPGGVVTGVPELGDLVASIDKPVIAHTSRLMASAAYWIGAGAQAIYATKSSRVGSVGVMLPIMIIKKYYEAMGVEIDMIKAGRLKGAGYPGTELSDEQREDLQESVDYLYRQFTGFVQSRREVDIESMQGQDFYAELAMGQNMVDSIADLDKAIADARALATGQYDEG